MFDVEKIRSDFPILKSRVYGKPLVYLDNAATTQKPLSVLKRVQDFYSGQNSNVHRGPHFLSQVASEQYEAAREAVKKFINASHPSEIVFTRGTTESINLVAQSFCRRKLNPGDEIIVTEMEHHSNLVPWQRLCEEKGAVLKVVPFDDNGELRAELLDDLLCEKTRFFALTSVSNVLGTVNQVRKLVEIAHSKGVPVMVDGAQTVQHHKTDVRDTGCDFFAFSGHKMFAETGIGVLYGKKELLQSMEPYQVGGGMVDFVDFGHTEFSEVPFRFEAGTQNIAGALSLHAAIDYLEKIGLEDIAAHEAGLLDYATERISALDRVRIIGRAEHKCGVLSFVFNGISSYDAASVLDKMGVAVRSGTHCAQPVSRHFGVNGTVRASFALYNTREEIDILVRGAGRVLEMFR
ncbi:MAG: aminotransferase class V-fold PLP-dependent enzyme [Chitinispirillaceae bacterium]